MPPALGLHAGSSVRSLTPQASSRRGAPREMGQRVFISILAFLNRAGRRFSAAVRKVTESQRRQGPVGQSRVLRSRASVLISLKRGTRPIRPSWTGWNQSTKDGIPVIDIAIELSMRLV